MEKVRDRTLDIAKAICIILMVVGHSGCPTYLYNFLYLFHVPCFFFISGWLLSDKYLDDLKTGLLKKAQGSYVPFVKWTLIFLLFHNVFASMHIYADSYSWQTFIERVVRAFTMTGGESLLGGFWFLISLFWASVGAVLFLHFLHKNQILTFINIWGGVILLLIITTFWHYLPISLPQMFGEQTLLATIFYLSGYACHKQIIEPKHPAIYGATLLVIPAIVAIFLYIGMTEAEGWLVPLYYFIAMAGTIGILWLSKSLVTDKVATRILGYIGDKTLYILIFHFLAFKLVSFIYIHCTKMPIELLEQSPVSVRNNWIWVVYSLTGIGLSLLAWELIHSMPLKLRKK